MVSIQIKPVEAHRNAHRTEKHSHGILAILTPLHREPLDIR